LPRKPHRGPDLVGSGPVPGASGLGLDYLFLVVLASAGVLQLAAAYGGLRGLLLHRNPTLSVLLGLLMIAAGFIWFFAPGPRHIPDTHGGLDGNQQAGIFAIGAASAILLTLILSSLTNHKRLRFGPTNRDGLDSLRDATYLRLVAQGIRRTWKG
jgi:hypothetical protein